MKIAHYAQVITPETGTLLAGYYANDVSAEILDDLKLSVLLMDDGDNKGAILAFDLLGMDEDVSIKIAGDAAEIIGCPTTNVIITCSHTHSGPHTRSSAAVQRDNVYVSKLYDLVKKGVSEAMKNWQEVDLFFHSSKCDQNYNRRYVDGANKGLGVAGNHWVEPLATEYADKELGLVIFTKPNSPCPVGVLVNYAAHPLAAHAMGRGGYRISADFPGMLRNFIEKESCWCVFAQGAAGDLFPKNAEGGSEAAADVAKAIAIKTMQNFCDAIRHPEHYRIENPKIRTSMEIIPLDFREDKIRNNDLPALYKGQTVMQARVHLFAIGDICFVGVPGELLNELGQEIKWHSPFKKAFIFYNSTSYLSYICHANSFFPGGYEQRTSMIKPYEGLKLVVATVDGMRKLHEPFAEEL